MDINLNFVYDQSVTNQKYLKLQPLLTNFFRTSKKLVKCSTSTTDNFTLQNTLHGTVPCLWSRRPCLNWAMHFLHTWSTHTASISSSTFVCITLMLQHMVAYVWSINQSTFI